MANPRTVSLSIISILAAIVVIGGGGYYIYQQQNYVTTDNASIQGTMSQITSPADGTLVNWRVSDGATVQKGTVIGQVQGLTGTTDITAPITGTFLQNNAVDREVVVPGESLGTMSNLNNLQIVANVNETDISNVAVGKPVNITIDAYPGTLFTGTVSQIGSASTVLTEGIPNTSLTGNFNKVVQRVPVYITINGTEGKQLIPGLSAEVSINRN
ncbi:efflux RND transporter periplasmic adaptor subunit [Ferroacidibacillus organovorans]|uniref:RND efflux pump membrane fusion protein barrel-sandwich domain-containing protein n=1 Tax=Ferroacidibacillus organovorans TaxID=1765683 RepID=A0A117SXB3_9BACL|nr:efflux RND transporter periplasmic adaptor subunit [Ferroacidibacillus organovorans]KUO95149.1 hypothetical protein ATW55_13430 [Ferroacidibacillus organovorans]